MRILHVITRLILGGAQQNTVLSCAAQAQAGHDVHLAYGPIHGPEGSLLDEAKASGATLHELPNLVREIAPLTDWRGFRELRHLVRELQPDLVHTHSSKAGILGRVAAWGARTPLPPGGAGGGCSFPAEVTDTGHPLRPAAPATSPTGGGGRTRPIVLHTVHGLPFHDEQSRLKHTLYVALERFAAKRCDHLIAITDAMADAFVQHRIAPRDQFTVIPSGVDLARFTNPSSLSPASAGGAQPPLTLGLVARLDPLKGHRDLIAALPRIVNHLPGARVVFVGDGFDRQGIERAIADSPHADRIERQHLVPFADMPAVYHALDVCVLPSYQEGQSRVLVEALAAGCPIVAYDVGGIPEVCIHERTGLLVPVGDTHALADACVRMLIDDTLRRRTVEAGQAHVHERFSAEKMNRDLLALYARLAGQPMP